MLDSKGEEIKISTRNLNFYYGNHQALFNNNSNILGKRVTAVIGPFECGKSTYLRCLNRIFELYRDQRTEGEIIIDKKNILDRAVDVLELRRKIGMIFQKPTPFPMSVFDNVAYGLKLHFKLSRKDLSEHVEKDLIGASLWDEVKDKLKRNGMALSGGQQQCLCIARAIAAEPEILLMDEPTSAIDPVGTLKVEDLIEELKTKFTIVIVTHNMQQAARVSDYTAFFYKGEIVEYNQTEKIFTSPKKNGRKII